jgi:ADP-heptose:LPS heptosyltransferase
VASGPGNCDLGEILARGRRLSRQVSNAKRRGISAFVPQESRGIRFLVNYDPLLRACQSELARKNFETLLDRGRLVAVLELARHATRKKKGDLIELGVYKGGSAGAIAWALRNAGIERTLHLCDTFEGMPKTLDWEFHEEYDFADTSLLAVSKRLNELTPGFPIRYHQGLFSEALPGISENLFCFAHIDADLYESVKQACEFVYPRMAKGGVILFDDYGASTCPGAKKAVDEFFEHRVEKPTHVSMTSYGVVIGRSETDFSTRLLGIAGIPAVGRAAYRGPLRTIGIPLATALDSIASAKTSRVLGRALRVRTTPTATTGSELKEANTVLVIRLDTAGDLVLTSAFLRELRKSKKNARIILAVDKKFANLVELCPWIDELQTIGDVGAGPAQRFRQYRQGFRFARTALRTKQIDLALLPRWDVDYYHAADIAYLSGAPNRIGYSEGVNPAKQYQNRGMDKLLTRVIADREPKHEVERNLDFLRAVGGTSTDNSLELWLSEKDRECAKRALESGGMYSNGPIIALAPGAGHPKRQWPLGRFIQLGVQLIGEFNYRIVVVGGPEDQERASRLSEALGRGAVSVAGQMTLRETAAVLEHTNLVIANDSGPMHLAGAAGVPVVEISCHPMDGNVLHANAPERFHPWEERYEVVRPVRPHDPCTSSCEWHDAHCILGISTEVVMDAVRRLQVKGRQTASRVVSEARRG